MIQVLAVTVLTVLLGTPQVAGVTAPPQAPPARDTSSLPKGTASIKGKVVAANGGRPLRRVQITLSTLGGGAESATVSTNGQGIFEFPDLAAGRYMITATRGGYLRLQYGQRHPGEPGRPIELRDGGRVTDADFTLPRASALVGRVVDEVGDPLPNASVFPMQWRFYRGQRRVVPVEGGGPFNRTDDTGQFRITGLSPGEYMVMITTRESWTDEKNTKERIGFLPTYSGGTANPAEAMKIKVELGAEAVVPDITMVPGRVGTISGVATSSGGRPLAGETISMGQTFQGPGTSSSFGAASTKIGPDGAFTIRNVVPGEYRLTIQVAATDDSPAEGVTSTVFFSGEDMGGVSLVTSPGSTIRGKVITDTGEALPRDQRTRVTLRPVDPTNTFSRLDTDGGRVREDGTFETASGYGLTRLSVSPLPPGWHIRSIEYQGKDLADFPVDLKGSRVEGVTILLTKTLPTLRGTLTDQSGKPGDGTILMFPQDRAKWSEESRLNKAVRPDRSGAFEIRLLIPGDYYAVAVPYARDYDWTDPAFLESLVDLATKVRIEESGAPAALSLTLKAPR